MRIEYETNRFYLARFYSEAVAAAGGAPVHIGLIPEADYIGAVMDNLDGILLPGSDSDADPSLYGQEPQLNLGSVHPEKDQTDWLVLEELDRRRMPLLAICFGMQIWNVKRGGTLIQDIRTEVNRAIKHQQGAPPGRASHRVRLQKESLVAELAGTDEVFVNSHHHQAVGRIGRDLVATAWSADGLIEALEEAHGDRFALGVQWHPELGWVKDPLSKSLFQRFIEAAREYRDRDERMR